MSMPRSPLSALDQFLATADRALRTLSDSVAAQRPNPADAVPEMPLADAERREAAALMRVNHVGEVCAQALYEGQALAADDAALRAMLREAADEEIDHLAWTRQRIDQLGGRPSLLNPLWFAGAFAMGVAASRLGRTASLGFMAETERQVEQHLDGHLRHLPAEDRVSRAIVEQMKHDEASHAQAATAAGGARVPWPVEVAMRAAARVMTSVAHRI
jgi:3-demethoxyubiquinol 3-hydroxylase